MTKARNASDRARLLVLFPDLASAPDEHFLALRRYARDCPESLFDETAHEFSLKWLNQRETTERESLHAYLAGNEAEINRALLFLREINSESWHDVLPQKGDEYDLIRFIDKHVHPTYLRLVEAILIPLVRVVAHFSRLDRGKGTDGLDVWSTVRELSRSVAVCLVRPYHHTLRNGIAHGGITYLKDEIRYRDKKGNEETLSTSAIVRLCDDLLDTCNGIAAAFKIFLIVSRDRGYPLPQELLLEELQEGTLAPWWCIEGCVLSEVGDLKQLLIYAHSDSRDSAKVQWSTIQSGILAEFFAPGYDRYFFSLRSPKAWPGWAVFNGKKLKGLRLSGANDLTQFGGVVEDGQFFYVPRLALPRLLGKVDTFVHSLKLNWPLIREQQRQAFGAPDVVCRNANIHRNSWGVVLSGAVVIDELEGEVTPEVIRKFRRRIIRIALKNARRTTSRLTAPRYLPLGYARLSVFRKNYRRRRLSGFGLGEDLVCTVQFQRIGRIRSPDIMGSTVEEEGRWRIAWNRKWLESSGQQVPQADIGNPRR